MIFGIGGAPHTSGSYQTWRGRFAVALDEMWRVVFALVLRESRTRFGKSDLGYAWAVIDPLIQLLVLWAIYSVFGRHVPIAASMPVFLVTGILPYNFWRECVSRGATGVSSNLPLLTYPQVKVADVIIARVLLDAATFAVLIFVFILGLNIFYGEPLSSWYDEPMPLAWALLALFYFSFAFAMLSSAIQRIFSAWSTVFGYLSRPLWFTSGIFFTLESLPEVPRHYVSYNPIAHMIEWLRSAALPGFESAEYSPVYVLAWATGALFIGLAIGRILILTGHADETG